MALNAKTLPTLVGSGAGTSLHPGQQQQQQQQQQQHCHAAPRHIDSVIGRARATAD
jgi:hypothetical protein